MSIIIIWSEICFIQTSIILYCLTIKKMLSNQAMQSNFIIIHNDAYIYMMISCLMSLTFDWSVLMIQST